MRQELIEITIEESLGRTSEQLGSKDKFWYNNGCYLFKEGRLGTGENWAEVVAAKICTLLEIPHAEYEFAKYDKKMGVRTKNFVPSNGKLIHANEFLNKYSSITAESIKKFKNTNYSITRSLAILRELGVKYNVSIPDCYKNKYIKTPLDLFIGYLLLDTLISNSDRHPENWGIIVLDKKNIFLAPTFDHASSRAASFTFFINFNRKISSSYCIYRKYFSRYFSDNFNEITYY